MLRTEWLPLTIIQQNEGQVEGLPENPRKWSTREMERLVRSIIETPELVELRPPIVVREGDIYVAIGGNMRLAAMKDAGITEAECIIIEDMPPEKLKEIAIKDNVQMGRFSMDALANEWSDLPLSDWGIPSYDDTEYPAKSRDAEQMDDRRSIEIKMNPDEYTFAVCALRDIAPTPENAVLKLLGL